MWLLQKPASYLSFHFFFFCWWFSFWSHRSLPPPCVFFVLPKVSSNASLQCFFRFFLFPELPLPLPPSKQACPEHWGTSVLWLRKKMRTAKKFPAANGCDFCVHVCERSGVFPRVAAAPVFSHLLVLRCRVENVPGRSASGCLDCWLAPLPSLTETEGNRWEKNIMETDERKHSLCAIFLL